MFSRLDKEGRICMCQFESAARFVRANKICSNRRTLSSDPVESPPPTVSLAMPSSRGNSFGTTS